MKASKRKLFYFKSSTGFNAVVQKSAPVVAAPIIEPVSKVVVA